MGAGTSARTSQIAVRLTAAERQALEGFMAHHGLTCSQAVRTLLALSLEQIGDVSGALTKKAYREGYGAAVKDLKDKLGAFLEAA